MKPADLGEGISAMDAKDRAVAESLAQRVVAAGGGRVRRVAVIGSRACGTASSGSDLDVVVVLETPLADGPWSMQRMAEERQRIMAAVGMPPLPTDLWVLSSDQYAEGHRVFGGIEYFAEHEGATVYAAPLQRAPIIRRPPAVVRMHNVRAWAEDAASRLHKAAEGTKHSLVTGIGRASLSGTESHATAAVEKGVMALCVLHQRVHSTKGSGLHLALADLAHREPELAPWITEQVTGSDIGPVVAHRILRVVLIHLAKAPGLERHIAALAGRVAGMRIVLPFSAR